MRPVLRIDGYDQGGIEEQPNIGPEPSTAKIARTKYPAIRTGIVRSSVASHHGYDQEQQREPIHGYRLFQPTARVSHALHNPFNFASACPAQGLRDFSPGAKAISAIRPPFRATQEFLVTGYLSV